MGHSRRLCRTTKGGRSVGMVGTHPSRHVRLALSALVAVSALIVAACSDGSQRDEELLPTISRYGIYAINVNTGDVIQIIEDENANLSFSPDGTRIVYTGDTGIFIADHDGSNSVQLDDTPPPYNVSWYPDSTHLAYANDNGLFLVDTATSETVRIVDGQTPSPLVPIVTSDTSELRYYSDESLYVINSDGTNGRHILDLRDEQNPAISANRRVDATRILFRKDSGVWMADIDGQDARLLSPIGGAFGIEWSPDGEYLVYYSGRGSYIVDAHGSDPLRLAPSMGWTAWSNDSSYVAMSVNSGLLVVAEADGRNQQVLTTHARAGYPKWSPDSRRLFYAITDARAGDDQGAYVANVQTGDTYRLDPDTLNGPDWSPDGSRMVYGSLRHHFVADADGRNPIEITKYNFPRPKWSPDGTHIALNDGGGLYVVDAYGQNAVRISRRWYESLSWSDDSSRIAYLTHALGPDDDTDTGIYVVDADGNNRKRLADAHVTVTGSRIIFLPDGQNLIYEEWGGHIE